MNGSLCKKFRQAVYKDGAKKNSGYTKSAKGEVHCDKNRRVYKTMKRLYKKGVR